MSQLPQFPREPIRDRRSMAIDAEFWQPKWKCFCCEDTGFVSPRLVERIIPGYNPDEDRVPICHRCDAADWAVNSPIEMSLTLDWRFDKPLCQQLDQLNRQEWRKTAQQQQLANQPDPQVNEQIHQLSERMNLRSRGRNWQEIQAG